MITGTVKWYREDATGYVMDAQGNTFYTDGSVCDVPWQAMRSGVAVTFATQEIWGRTVAVDVKLAPA